MIVYKTSMEEMPHDCVACKMTACTLPEKKNSTDIKTKYMLKRHKSCPLFETISTGIKTSDEA